MTSDEYAKMVTGDHDLNQKIIDLQKNNLEFNQTINELRTQIAKLEDHGIKFSIDEEKLGRVISNNDKTFSFGDVLIGSSTIVGFFGFSSLIIIKFQSNTKIKEKLRLLRFFYCDWSSYCFSHNRNYFHYD